jgi:quinol monooxygenase YgiN
MTMSNQITCVFEMDVLPGKLESFRDVIRQAVAATHKEPGVLLYEYGISDDGKKAYIVERYRAEALIPHVDETFAPFAQPFLDHVTFSALTVFGDATPEMRKRLDTFGAIYVKTFAGFDRFPA